MAIAAFDPLPINPIRFVPVEGELPTDPRDNLVHFDADWFTNYIRDWQTKTEYIQPWQFNDRPSIYFDSSSDEGATLQLIDCTGRVRQSWNITTPTTVATNVFKIGATEIQAHAFYKRFKFDVLTVPEGIYWLYLTVAHDLNADTVVDYYRHLISEPLSIATLHPGTSHTDYYNTTNKHGVLFVQTGAKFSIRLKADIIEYSFPSTDTQWEDGSNDAQLLASTVYRKAKYALTKRVPEWVTEKLSYAFGCNKVSVDNLPCTKDIGAQWDMGRLAKHPKVFGSIPIRISTRDATTQIVATTFEMGTFNFPYAVLNVGLIDLASSTNYFDVAAAAITDSTEEAAFVALLNADAALQGWAGTVSITTSGVGGANRTFNWTNGAGDMFVTSTMSVLTSYISAQLTTTNIAQPIAFNNPNILISWGDGNAELLNAVGAISSPVHNYPTSGTWDILIFGTYTTIGFDDGYLNAVGGLVPFGLVWFVITNSFTITSFDCSILVTGSTAQTVLAVYNCSALATISNVALINYTNISLISFANNALSTADASAIVVDVDTEVSALPVSHSGGLYINGNSAPMNVAGATAKANLITSHGWTVLTD